MQKKKIAFKVFTLALSCALVAGCASIGQSEEKVTTLAANEYKLFLYEPWSSSYSRFRDRQMERAKDFCSKKSLGMMPIDAETRAKEKGYEGEIVFRCVERLEGPSLGWF